MSLQRVKPGVIRIPATDYNQIADATEAVQSWQKSFKAGLENMFDNGGIMIDICNDGSEAIPIYSPIELISPLPVLTDGNAAQYNGIRPAFKAKAASSTTKDIFVIAQDKIEPKAIKPAIAQGITVAKVTISSTSHQYAVPDVANPGKLKSASSGICRMLWKAANTGEVWTVLMLGGGGSGAAEYTGLFKIIDATEGQTKQVKVVNGAYEDDANCGSWSFGSLTGTCAKTTIAISVKTEIYLKLTFDPAAKTCVGVIETAPTLPANSPTVDIMSIGVVYQSMAIQQVFKSDARYNVLNRWTI